VKRSKVGLAEPKEPPLRYNGIDLSSQALFLGLFLFASAVTPLTASPSPSPGDAYYGSADCQISVTQQATFQTIMSIANASDDPTSLLNAMQKIQETR
jgi:hypothetical protein